MIKWLYPKFMAQFLFIDFMSYHEIHEIWYVQGFFSKAFNSHFVTYLIPLNFRAPLIFTHQVMKMLNAGVR